MESVDVMSSMREGMEGGQLPRVAGERRLEQSLFFSALRRHPKCAALDEAILGARSTSFGAAWAVDIAKMRASDIASLGAYFWPNSADDKRAITLIKVMQWFTLVDDAYGDLHDVVLAHRLSDNLIHDTFEPGLPCPPRHDELPMAHGHVHEKQPLITAVGWEWWQEMQQSISPSQRERFRAEFCQYLREQAHEVEFREKYSNRSTGKLLEVEEYTLLRRASSGLPVCITMVESDMGIEINQEKLRNPQLKELHNAIADLACWINDILSFPKELANGELLNLLAVLHMRNMNAAVGRADEVKVPFEEALSEAWRMIEAREEECAALAHVVMMQAGHAAEDSRFRKYVENACGIYVGIWAWTLQSARYSNVPAGARRHSCNPIASLTALLRDRVAIPLQVPHSLPLRVSLSRHPPSVRLLHCPSPLLGSRENHFAKHTHFLFI